jgi:hypothetical protein
MGSTVGDAVGWLTAAARFVVASLPSATVAARGTTRQWGAIGTTEATATTVEGNTAARAKGAGGAGAPPPGLGLSLLSRLLRAGQFPTALGEVTFETTLWINYGDDPIYFGQFSLDDPHWKGFRNYSGLWQIRLLEAGGAGLGGRYYQSRFGSIKAASLWSLSPDRKGFGKTKVHTEIEVGMNGGDPTFVADTNVAGGPWSFDIVTKAELHANLPRPGFRWPAIDPHVLAATIAMASLYIFLIFGTGASPNRLR